MNISLNRNSVRSDLLKKRFQQTYSDINISDLFGYLTVLLKFITLNIKMDSDLCLYSLCDVNNFRRTIGDVFMNFFAHKHAYIVQGILYGHKQYAKKHPFDKNHMLYINLDDCKYGYDTDDYNEGIIKKELLRKNYNKNVDNMLDVDKYDREILSYIANLLQINDYYFNILNIIDKEIFNCKQNFLYNYVLPKNIIELEVINIGFYYAYKEQMEGREYNWKKYAKLEQTKYYDMQNSKMWLEKLNWPKIGRACETCDISGYDERFYPLLVSKRIKENFNSTYDPIYDRIDRCLWDKYQGRYTVKSNDGITYGDLAKAVKMVMISKFVPPKKFDIYELKLESINNISNKYRLTIVLDSSNNFSDL